MVHSTRRFNELTLEKLAEMKEQGKTEQEISKFFGLTVTTFRLIKAKMLETLGIVQTDIYERMRERGMPRKDIAEIIGVPESTIRAWETGDAVE